MFTKEELRYAQKYPFSSIGKSVVTQSALDLGDLTDQVLDRAETMITASVTRKPYQVEIRASSDLLRNEVLAFPVAKIFLSVIERNDFYPKFASFVAKNAFKNLLKESKGNIQELANDLEINFKFSTRENAFAEILLLDFLSARFQKDFMKLVNQPVSSGIVFLTKNDFCRYVSEIVFQNILDSLPVDTSSIPKRIKDRAKSVSSELSEAQRRSFKEMTFGKVKPELFPPCMSELYVKLLEGKNLSHSARFYLAAFLAAVGMNSEQIIELFKNTPNFKERITRYQVERISGKSGTKYSPPSCAKMRTNKLCTARCQTRHPVQLYRNNLFPKKQKQQTQPAAA